MNYLMRFHTRRFLLVFLSLMCANNSQAKDDLQEFIDNQTGTGFITVDLANFNSVVRDNTLKISTGRNYKFINGTLKRSENLNGPLVSISNESNVIIESNALFTVSSLNYNEVVLLDGGKLSIGSGGSVVSSLSRSSTKSAKRTTIAHRSDEAIKIINSKNEFVLDGGKVTNVSCFSDDSFINIIRGTCSSISSNSNIYLEGDADVSSITLNSNSNVIFLKSSFTHDVYIYKMEYDSPIVIGNGYQLTSSDISHIKAYGAYIPPTSGMIVYPRPKNQLALVLKRDNILFIVKSGVIVSADDLQAKLDAIADKGTANEFNPDTINIAEVGIDIDKMIFVRDKCHAVLKGGNIHVTNKKISNYVFLIETDNSSLSLKDMVFDCKDDKNVAFDYYFGIKGGQYSGGKLTIDKGVTFANNSLDNTVGLCELSDGCTLIYKSESPEGFKAKDFVVRGGGNFTFAYIWSGLMESTSTTISGDLHLCLYGGTIKGGNKVINVKSIWMQGETASICSIVDNAILAETSIATYMKGNFAGLQNRVVIKHSAVLFGSMEMPQMMLQKTGRINVESEINSDWTFNSSEWGDFPLETSIIRGSQGGSAGYQLTIGDFNRMTFLNMHAGREAYYDKTDQTVKLREQKICDSDDLLNALLALEGNGTGTEDNHATLAPCDSGLAVDNDVDIDDDLYLDLVGKKPDGSKSDMVFSGSSINVMTGSTVRMSQFVMKSEGNGGGISNSGNLTISDCELQDGDYTVENLSGSTMTLNDNTFAGSGIIVNSGNLYVDGSCTVNGLKNNAGGCIFLTSTPMTYIRIILDEVTVESLGVPVIAGADGYILTETDANALTIDVPDGYEWYYDADMQAVCIRTSTAIEDVRNNKTRVAEGYDTSGRKVSDKYRGLRILRMNDGSVKKNVKKN